MKKLFFILLSAMTLTAAAQNAEKAPLPQWFMKPAAHTYVGICEPNGDVQQAINAALLHYLICHDFSGKTDRKMSMISTSEETVTEMRTIMVLDTTVQYSIEEIVSTPNGEYICRISDRPTLRRQIKLKYMKSYQSIQNGENDASQSNEAFECYFRDETGKSMMAYTLNLSYDKTGTTNYAYSSQYFHENGLSKEYANDKTQTSWGEQLIVMYVNRLENDFVGNPQSGADAEIITDGYHKARPISGFEYIAGQIIEKF